MKSEAQELFMKLHQSEDNENALIDEAVIDGICRLARVAPTFVWRASLVKKIKTVLNVVAVRGGRQSPM